MMNKDYLLIEIVVGKIFYTVCSSITKLNIEKHTVIFPDIKDKTELLCESIQEKIVFIMNKENHTPVSTRVYLRSEVFRNDIEKRKKFRNQIYIKTGLNLILLTEQMEAFYRINQKNNDDISLIEGISIKEFQKVVLCGSFRKYLDKVKETYEYCVKNGVDVLSPKNLTLKDMYNDNFALFHGEYISNERETYLIESKHTQAIRDADAVIICNPDGYIGTRTLYEIGYADAIGKRIIFLYKESDEFDICFPRDYGLI